MAGFKIDKEDLKTFLKVCAMEGAIQFRDGKSVNKAMFSALNIIVSEECIKVATVDTHRKKTNALITKTGITILEEGEIPITNYEAIQKVLKGKGLKGEITVKSKGTILTLESDGGKDFYEIRQKTTKDLDAFKNDDQIQTSLRNWIDWHKFDGENGILIMHAIHPKTKQQIDVPYMMRLKVSKEDLEKMVGDIINITKDNKTLLKFKDSKLEAYKGAANASTKSKHEIEYTDLGTELMDFEEEFYSLQTIIPNLFDEIILNIRRVKANNTITIYITSKDEKSNIEIHIGIASIIIAQEEEEN